MINYIKKKFYSFLNLSSIKKDQSLIKINQGKILMSLKDKKISFNDFEVKVFSQFGEDGLIDHLINILNLQSKTFIEFGVEDYNESNTRFLLEARNWKGLIFDSSDKYVNRIKSEDYYWRENIIAKKAFINAENINELIINNIFFKDVGLLSIDIDGNDYWIWKSLNCIKSSIVVIEYNARFGFQKSVTVPYKKNFKRQKEHHSSVYFGASLAALHNLGNEKGYSLVGTNLNGNNAFFVRSDLVKENNILTFTPEECFNINSFNELRDKNGNILEKNILEEEKILNSLPLEEV